MARRLLIALALAAAISFGAETALAAPGDLDPSFGTGGKFTQAVGPRNAQLLAAVRQPDGKVVSVGSAEQSASAPNNLDFLVVRLNPNGTLDGSFGSGGIVQTPVSAGTEDDTATAVALGPNGTIYAAGKTDPPGAGDSADFAVVRYTSTGAVDTTFSGPDGIQTHSLSTTIDSALAAAVQADGKVVLAGIANTSAGGFIVMRLEGTSGALDTAGFNSGGGTPGVQEIDFTGGFALDRASGLAIVDGGRILVSGTADGAGAASDFALARLNTDGSLDTAGFGAGTGKVQTPGAGTERAGDRALTIDAQGRILLAGALIQGGNVDFLVARYLADGTSDSGWSGDGVQTTDFTVADGTRFAQATAVLVEPEGNIIATGHAFSCAQVAAPTSPPPVSRMPASSTRPSAMRASASTRSAPATTSQPPPPSAASTSSAGPSTRLDATSPPRSASSRNPGVRRTTARCHAPIWRSRFRLPTSSVAIRAARSRSDSP